MDSDEATALEHTDTKLRMRLGSGVESDNEDNEIRPIGPESPEMERLRHALN